MQRALTEFLCKELYKFVGYDLRVDGESWKKFGNWSSSVRFEKDEYFNTLACKIPIHEYFKPIPAYELSEEKLYRELLELIKSRGYTFEDFKSAVEKGFGKEAIERAVQKSLTVSGPQVEFQEVLIQKTQEMLRSISPTEVLLEKIKEVVFSEE